MLKLLSLSGRLLRQCGGVAVVGKMTECLARPGRRPCRLVRHVHGAARRHMRRAVGQRRLHVGRLLLHRVVRWHRVVGTLSRHTIWPGGRRPKPWLWQWLLVPSVAHVRRVELRATMPGARSSIGTSHMRWRRWLQRESVARHERLRFRVERLPVITTGDGMLTLGIARVDVCRELPVSIRDPWRRYGARPRGIYVLAIALLGPRWL